MRSNPKWAGIFSSKAAFTRSPRAFVKQRGHEVAARHCWGSDGAAADRVLLPGAGPSLGVRGPSVIGQHPKPLYEWGLVNTFLHGG